MDIIYLGHSSFKLKGKKASVVTDPYNSKVGFPFPRISADIVTVSHDHFDHNNFSAVTGTARREQTFVIQYPGEYEVSGISVFGISSFHDKNSGASRGKNTMFVIRIDQLNVAHLGDLGEMLSDKQTEEIGEVDVLLLPVGGVYTIGAKEAVEVVSKLQPAIVIPMHYKTSKHNPEAFKDLDGVDEFLKEGGYGDVAAIAKLTLTRQQLPEETEVVILKA